MSEHVDNGDARRQHHDQRKGTNKNGRGGGDEDRRKRSLAIVKNFIRFGLSSIVRSRGVLGGASGDGTEEGGATACPIAIGDTAENADGPFILKSFFGLKGLPLIKAVDEIGNVISEEAYLVTQWLERGVFPQMELGNIRSLVVLISSESTASNQRWNEDDHDENRPEEEYERGNKMKVACDLRERAPQTLTTTLEAFRFLFLPLQWDEHLDAASSSSGVGCIGESSEEEFAQAFLGSQGAQVDYRYICKPTNASSNMLEEIRTALLGLTAYCGDLGQHSAGDLKEGKRSNGVESRAHIDVINIRPSQYLSFALEYNEHAPESLKPPFFTESAEGCISLPFSVTNDGSKKTSSGQMQHLLTSQSSHGALPAQCSVEELRVDDEGGGRRTDSTSRIFSLGGFQTSSHEVRVSCFKIQGSRREESLPKRTSICEGKCEESKDSSRVVEKYRSRDLKTGGALFCDKKHLIAERSCFPKRANNSLRVSKIKKKIPAKEGGSWSPEHHDPRIPPPPLSQVSALSMGSSARQRRRRRKKADTPYERPYPNDGLPPFQNTTSPKRPRYITFGDEGVAERNKFGALTSSAWTPPPKVSQPKGAAAPNLQVQPPPLTPKRTPSRRKSPGSRSTGGGTNSRLGSASEAPTILASECYSTTPPRS